MPKSKTKPPRRVPGDNSSTEIEYQRLRKLQDELEHRQRGFRLPRRHVSVPHDAKVTVYFTQTEAEAIKSTAERLAKWKRRHVSKFTVPEFIRAAVNAFVTLVPDDEEIEQILFVRHFGLDTSSESESEVEDRSNSTLNEVTRSAVHFATSEAQVPATVDPFSPPKLDRRTKSKLSTGRARRSPKKS
jgi:hypothetical protein